jgi:hypothetical protein
MEHDSYEFVVEDDDRARAGSRAAELAISLSEIDGVTESIRRKTDYDAMDLGAIVDLIVSSGATVAIARGVAAWLRSRRGTGLRIYKDGKSGSIKAVVSGIDPAAAALITEIIRGN